MITNSNQQALTQQAVQKAAETLMLLHQQTTTLEVKNYLRREKYLAMQRDVSHFMATLAQQQKDWKTRDNGRYKIYRFAQDSQVTFHEYLENGKDFWEIEVDKLQVITTLGKIGTDGGSYTTSLQSNRFAIHQAHLLVQQKINTGYTKAVDQRLSKLLRTRYEKWLQQEVQQYTLAFYGVEKIEKQSANLSLDSTVVSAYLLSSKSAGYEISFKSPSDIKSSLELLDKKSWDATQINFISLYLTGEKIIHQAAFSEDHQPIKDFKIQNLSGQAELQQLLVHQENLYQVRLIFKNHKTLTLSKFELDLTTELLPLLQAFLKLN